MRPSHLSPGQQRDVRGEKLLRLMTENIGLRKRCLRLEARLRRLTLKQDPPKLRRVE